MDALMAIDSDILDGENGTEYLPGEGSLDTDDPNMEEIIFDATDDGVDSGDDAFKGQNTVIGMSQDTEYI